MRQFAYYASSFSSLRSPVDIICRLRRCQGLIHELAASCAQAELRSGDANPSIVNIPQARRMVAGRGKAPMHRRSKDPLARRKRHYKVLLLLFSVCVQGVTHAFAVLCMALHGWVCGHVVAVALCGGHDGVTWHSMTLRRSADGRILRPEVPRGVSFAVLRCGTLLGKRGGMEVACRLMRPGAFREQTKELNHET